MTDTFRELCAELANHLQGRKDLECGWPGEDPEQDLLDRALALLAQPEPVPTDEEIGEWHDQCADLTRLGEVDHYWAFDLQSDEVAGVVRAALARWGTPAIEPVPVSERLPGPEDCDSEGRCWGGLNADDGWSLYLMAHLPEWSFWLPHWALPVPAIAAELRAK
jgi:hypothetical protein